MNAFRMNALSFRQAEAVNIELKATKHKKQSVWGELKKKF